METFSLQVPSDEWTLVAAGSETSLVGIQLDTFSGYAGLGAGACAIAIAASQPDLSSDDWILLSSHGDQSVSFDLPDDRNIYARGLSGIPATQLRGYRKDR
jgi:hypothetical protein